MAVKFFVRTESGGDFQEVIYNLYCKGLDPKYRQNRLCRITYEETETEKIILVAETTIKPVDSVDIEVSLFSFPYSDANEWSQRKIFVEFFDENDKPLASNTTVVSFNYITFSHNTSAPKSTWTSYQSTFIVAGLDKTFQGTRTFNFYYESVKDGSKGLIVLDKKGKINDNGDMSFDLTIEFDKNYINDLKTIWVQIQPEGSEESFWYKDNTLITTNFSSPNINQEANANPSSFFKNPYFKIDRIASHPQKTTNINITISDGESAVLYHLPEMRPGIVSSSIMIPLNKIGGLKLFRTNHIYTFEFKYIVDEEEYSIKTDEYGQTFQYQIPKQPLEVSATFDSVNFSGISLPFSKSRKEGTITITPNFTPAEGEKIPNDIIKTFSIEDNKNRNFSVDITGLLGNKNYLYIFKWNEETSSVEESFRTEFTAWVWPKGYVDEILKKDVAVSRFSYLVWNRMCNWAQAYRKLILGEDPLNDYEKAFMTSDDRTLTAKRYNLLRECLKSSQDSVNRGDPVIAKNIKSLMSEANNNIKAKS